MDAGRVALVNAGKSPVVDKEISTWLTSRALNLRATLDAAMAFAGAEFAIVATPTNYDPKTSCFDTSSV